MAVRLSNPFRRIVGVGWNSDLPAGPPQLAIMQFATPFWDPNVEGSEFPPGQDWRYPVGADVRPSFSTDYINYLIFIGQDPYERRDTQLSQQTHYKLDVTHRGNDADIYDALSYPYIGLAWEAPLFFRDGRPGLAQNYYRDTVSVPISGQVELIWQPGADLLDLTIDTDSLGHVVNVSYDGPYEQRTVHEFSLMHNPGDLWSDLNTNQTRLVRLEWRLDAVTGVPVGAPVWAVPRDDNL